MKQQWYTVKEACEYLRVSKVTLYKLCNDGVLPYYKLKGVRGRRFKREDLDALLKPAGEQEKDIAQCG